MKSSVMKHDLQKQHKSWINDIRLVVIHTDRTTQIIRHEANLTDPLDEGRCTSEDSGFLYFVAHAWRNKAGYTLDVPPTVLTQTVQRTPGVSLWEEQRQHEGFRWRSCAADKLCQEQAGFDPVSLTLHPDTTSPPAHTMVVFTTLPHQSLRLHWLCSTTGSKACCSLSGMGPWADTQRWQRCCFNM